MHEGSNFSTSAATRVVFCARVRVYMCACVWVTAPKGCHVRPAVVWVCISLVISDVELIGYLHVFLEKCLLKPLPMLEQGCLFVVVWRALCVFWVPDPISQDSQCCLPYYRLFSLPSQCLDAPMLMKHGLFFLSLDVLLIPHLRIHCQIQGHGALVLLRVLWLSLLY